MRYMIPQERCGSTPGLLPVGCAQKTPREVVQEDLNQMLDYLSWLLLTFGITKVRYNDYITAENVQIHLSISCSEHSNSLHLGQQLTPHPEGERTMASDLEVPTLITATSHSAANHCSTQGHSLMNSKEPHHLQKAATQFWGFETGHCPHPCCTLTSTPWKSQTGSETRDSPGGIKYPLRHRHSSHCGYTATAPAPHTPKVPPTGPLGRHGCRPSARPQNTSRPDGQTPMMPQ